MSIINTKRLRDYPRLMFFTTWLILALNLLLRQGWLGGLHQIIGSDFITLYSAGVAYRIDLAHLYDFARQFSIQQALINPTLLPGVNPYISPPYVAQIYSLFTYITLPVAFFLWTLLSLGFAFGAIYLCHSLLPESMKSRLTVWQLLIIAFSFFPFIEGLQAGQNHTLTLLLISAVLVFTLSEHWSLAGVMAGLMIYKPQLVIGILVIWIIWRKYKALGAFAITSLLWAGSFYIINGIEPYKIYLSLSRDLFLLPYLEGFPGYLLITFYGLVTTIFPLSTLPIIRVLTIVFAFILLLVLSWLAFRFRNVPIIDKTPILALAILIPILVFPYALLHDMVIIIPAFILWARYSSSRILLYTAITVYLGCFILLLISTLTKIALITLIPISLIVMIILYIFKSRRDIFMKPTL